jgi:hypothetical protein
MSRRDLPQRRAAAASILEHGGSRVRLHVGFYPDGTVAELFLDSAKPNSGLDAFAGDAAILVSLLLQYGASVAEIRHALRRNLNGAPASLIGAAVDQLQSLEPSR